MMRRVLFGIQFVIAVLVLQVLASADAADPGAPRYLVITDMTHDDPQSLIRLLLYANEIEIAGIIVTNQRKDHGPNSEAPWNAVKQVLNAYGNVVTNLKLHDSRYPTLESLNAITWRHSGAPTISFAPNDDKFDDYIGTGNNKDGKPKSTEATKFLKSLFSQPDSRPLHVGLWGGAVSLAQAVWEYRQEVDPKQFQDFASRLYIFDVAAQDITNDFFVNAERLNQTFLGYGKSTFLGTRPLIAQYACFKNWGMYLGKDYIDPAIVRRAGGALTAPYGGGGEGDSPSFLYLVSSLYGLNEPTNLQQSSWGGHFRMAPEIASHAMVESKESPDTLRRWMSAARNDFYARAERCIKPVGSVNRNPVLSVSGDLSSRVIRMPVEAGSKLTIDVSGGFDPDGNQVKLSCIEDTYATSRSGPPLPIAIENDSMLNVSTPAGQTSDVHLILVGDDSGTPSLQAYRRIILVPRSAKTPLDKVTLGGRVFGTGTPFDENAKFENAFDGDLKTYVDLHQSSAQCVGIDLGEDETLRRHIHQIRYFPRAGFEFRMVDGEFQGANDASFENHDVLHRVQSPIPGWNLVTVERARAYRYLRYVGPKDGFANVAEIEFVSVGQ